MELTNDDDDDDEPSAQIRELLHNLGVFSFLRFLQLMQFRKQTALVYKHIGVTTVKIGRSVLLTLTSADAPAGWTGLPSHGDKSRQSPGPGEGKKGEKMLDKRRLKPQLCKFIKYAIYC